MADNNYIDPSVQAEAMRLRQAQDSDFLRFQIDVSIELEKTMRDFIGQSYVETSDAAGNIEGRWVADKDKQQQINLKGAEATMTFTKPYTSRIFSLSNHDEQSINKRCLEFANDLTFFLCRHKTEFEIISYQSMNLIIDFCDNLFYSTMMKALDGWEGNSIRKGYSTQEVKQTVISSEQKKQGFRIPFIGS